MTPVVLVCVAALLGTSGLAVALVRAPFSGQVVYGACLAAALALCAISLGSVAGAPSTEILPIGLPWLGAHFRLDPLAAVFLVIVDFSAAVASLYALGYGRHEPEPARVLPFYPAFLAAMNLAIVADDAYSFLFSWELMSLASWALVMARRRSAGVGHAGHVYLIMAALGSFALLFAFGLLAGPHADLSFAAIRARHLSPGVAGLALFLVIVGAGSKAGLVPLHAWLPLAHPAAPSHVSALMSGAMTKVAIYAFIRIAFDLMGAPSWWWSLPILLLGAGTAALGMLYALMETDLKRVLAYSTIENVGVVFMAVGLALAFKAGGAPGAAALALTGALLHGLNHMLFKSALFFSAGSAIAATGERDMERLGGLIRRMPLSSAAFLVAGMAASALPPLNGFASEWLILQSILVSPHLPWMGLKLAAPAAGVLLALAAALAAACFVRAFGSTYLGRARPAAAQASETDRWSLAAMSVCAGLCLLIGLFPAAPIQWLQPVPEMLVSGRMPAQTGTLWSSITPISAAHGSYDGLLLFVFLAASASLAAATVHRFAWRKARSAPFWDCGYPGLGLGAQYTAAGLAQPLRRVFATSLFSARERVELPSPGDPRPAVLRLDWRDPVWDFIYAPLGRAVGAAAEILNHVQFLTIRRYLSLVFAALVILLTALALWG